MSIFVKLIITTIILIFYETSHYYSHYKQKKKIDKFNHFTPFITYYLNVMLSAVLNIRKCLIFKYIKSLMYLV
jgi:hypothetical protein